MCKCTPEIRTPFCGKLGCEWPKPSGTRVSVDTSDNSDPDRSNFESWIRPQNLTFGVNRRWRGEGQDHKPYEYQNELVEFAWQAYSQALVFERNTQAMNEETRKENEAEVSQREADEGTSLHDGDFVETPV